MSIEEVVGLFLLIMFVAFIIEAMVEYFVGEIFNRFKVLADYKWTLKYAALAVGLLAAFNWRFDMVYILASYVKQLDIEMTVLGTVLTGSAIGRGANFIHDLWSKFVKKPPLE